MAMQGMGTAPARNTASAVGKQSKVSVGSGHASTVVASGAGQAPVKPGSSVQGHAGSGTKGGFVKV